ncbi:hypothetical protein L1276_004922 [Flavobacterium sp. HSC-32F16]|uniref:hypothetical protein n=1 Tax=Flavobacterium sp. HSC-32F16 TaxID=2910964 RepID=UPI0020A48439|nr:hypothetical protein [Flavobacterium sp. HSC-32F16]MCP2029728.1 hypothetical protein [Flavobacterium sp. HSC-32F16]
MKISTNPVIESVPQSITQSDVHFSDAAIQSEMHNSNLLTDLYRKYDDEPDFDCEFLCDAAFDQHKDENIIDPESEDDFLDEFNDNQWDADIYDPYLESTYY